MEKKKLLLVAISVGIFLVITIGAGVLIFTSKNPVPLSAVAANPSGQGANAVPPVSYQPPALSNSPVSSGSPAAEQPANPAGTVAGESALPSAGASGTASSPPVSVDAVDLIRNSDGVPGLKPPPEGTAGREGDFRVSGAAGAAGTGAETVISVARPTTAAVPNTAPAGRAAPSAASRPRTSTQARTTPQPAPASRPQASANRQKPAAQTKVYDDYWVQTGAFSTIATAERVKDTLASKGITSIVENRVVNGKTFFRVRVGPYTSQNEADYWLSLIRSIGGFEDSQVRQTQSRR